MSTPLLLVSYGALAWTVWLGGRLARGALRSRQAPDTLMASFFLAASGAYLVVLLRRTFPGLSPGSLEALYETAQALFHVPVVAMALFTWQVFRPGESWARNLAWGLAAVVLGSWAFALWVAPGLGLGGDLLHRPGAFYWATSAAKIGCFLWGCIEAVLYYGMARRRLALGLADPLVTNRFLLWALWSGAAAIVTVVRVVSPLFFAEQDAASVVPLPIVLSQMGAGLVAAGAIWLTFSPPAFYRGWVGTPQSESPASGNAA